MHKFYEITDQYQICHSLQNSRESNSKTITDHMKVHALYDNTNLPIEGDMAQWLELGALPVSLRDIVKMVCPWARHFTLKRFT